MYSLGQQIQELAVSIGLGMLVTFMLQVYQLALFRLKVARWYAWSWDLLFWLIAVGVVFASLLVVNGGEVRAHILLSLLAGAVLYRIYLYRRLQKIAVWLSAPLAMLLGGLYWLLTWPQRLGQRLRHRDDSSPDEDSAENESDDEEK